MIHTLADTLQTIPHYDDSVAVAHGINDLLERLMRQEEIRAKDLVTLQQAVHNLNGMHDLLRSARHHLAVKALDAV